MTGNYRAPAVISSTESTFKKSPFIKVAILSDVILVPNYHGCKEGEATNLISHYMLDTVYETVKAIFKKEYKSCRT